MLNELKAELQFLANPEQAKNLQRFFKTGEGQYGEGDVFLGIKVPIQRSVAKKYPTLSLDNLQKLLNSKIHEHRQISLFILTNKYKKSNNLEKDKIFNLYLENAKLGNINNWDLVDLSAPNIVGDFLFDKPREVLYRLAKSQNLWGKRIAIISTFAFIKKNQFEDTLKISEMLLRDKHDLIHKAVGWMLREVGKRDTLNPERHNLKVVNEKGTSENILENFLRRHYKKIPRTTLRYAIERFEEEKRKKYLRGEI